MSDPEPDEEAAEKDRTHQRILILSVLVASLLGLIGVLMKEGGAFREWFFDR